MIDTLVMELHKPMFSKFIVNLLFCSLNIVVKL